MEFREVIGTRLNKTGPYAITYEAYTTRNGTVIQFYVRGEADMSQHVDIYKAFAEAFTEEILDIENVNFNKKKFVLSKRGSASFQCATLYNDTAGKSSLLLEIELVKRIEAEKLDDYINDIYDDICQDEENYDDGGMVDDALDKYARKHMKQQSTKEKKEEVKEPIDILKLTEEQVELYEELVLSGVIEDSNMSMDELLKVLKEHKH